LGKPSPDWLGRYAASEKIRGSDLWNIQYIYAEPITLEAFQQLKKHILWATRV